MNTPPPIIKLGCASPHNPIKCLKKCNIASIMLSPIPMIKTFLSLRRLNVPLISESLQIN